MTGTKRGLDDDSSNDNKLFKAQSSFSSAQIITCELPPLCSTTPQHFTSTLQFESHYQKFHIWSCTQCHKVFPSERVLELHITERHDPFAAVRKERGDKIVCRL